MTAVQVKNGGGALTCRSEDLKNKNDCFSPEFLKKLHRVRCSTSRIPGLCIPGRCPGPRVPRPDTRIHGAGPGISKHCFLLRYPRHIGCISPEHCLPAFTSYRGLLHIGNLPDHTGRWFYRPLVPGYRAGLRECPGSSWGRRHSWIPQLFQGFRKYAVPMVSPGRPPHPEFPLRSIEKGAFPELPDFPCTGPEDVCHPEPGLFQPPDPHETGNPVPLGGKIKRKFFRPYHLDKPEPACNGFLFCLADCSLRPLFPVHPASPRFGPGSGRPCRKNSWRQAGSYCGNLVFPHVACGLWMKRSENPHGPSIGTPGSRQAPGRIFPQHGYLPEHVLPRDPAHGSLSRFTKLLLI